MLEEKCVWEVALSSFRDLQQGEIWSYQEKIWQKTHGNSVLPKKSRSSVICSLIQKDIVKMKSLERNARGQLAQARSSAGNLQE